jgi:hypothetical protein
MRDGREERGRDGPDYFGSEERGDDSARGEVGVSGFCEGFDCQRFVI